MIVVIDNYDSFTFNLVQALGALGAELRVFRNDAVGVDEVAALQPEAMVLSPGPGRPEGAGCCLDLVRELGEEVPILGVCLGHQAIGVAFGGSVIRAPEVVHGKTTRVRHSGNGLYRDLPAELEVARYHSLVLDPEGLPDELIVEATSDDGLVMGLRHRRAPLWGVQFHPESIATPEGPRLLRNFLRLAGERQPGGAEC